MRQVRHWIDLIETASALPGMAGVKARIAAEISDSDEPSADGGYTALQQHGLIDDLWITHDGGLMLYRSLELPQPWMKSLRKDGHRHWSTSAAGAHPYNGSPDKNTATVTIVAELRADTAGVDWDHLWQRYLELHHVGEDEVALEPGLPLVVRHVMVNGDEQSSKLVGRTLGS